MAEHISSLSVPVDNIAAASMGMPQLREKFDKEANKRGMTRVGEIELYPDGTDTGIRALVMEVVA